MKRIDTTIEGIAAEAPPQIAAALAHEAAGLKAQVKILMAQMQMLRSVAVT
jgi:hypothetical protein